MLVFVAQRLQASHAKKGHPMKVRSLLMLAVALGCLPAYASSVVVEATTDIWLAGQASGATVTGFFGTDTAPANSPIGIAVSGGDTLTFINVLDAANGVSVDGSCFDTTPDAGACYADEYGDSPGSANGISLAHLPAGALVGVFVAAGGPSGSAPTALDFTSGGIGTGFATLSPELDQLFFIGDGLTGTGTGSVQDFIAPTGAGTLYLAVSDSVGAAGNNLGSISANVNDVPEVSAAPEPGTLSLVGLGMVGMALAANFAQRRARTDAGL
jgi:hypothetical protein